MRRLNCIIFIFISFFSMSQGHEGWMNRISTIEEANVYASKHSDVIVSYVNYEKDRFLFDDIDTSHMTDYVGKSSTLFGRTTKFLKDTSLLMVDLQLIEFDTSASGTDAVDVLHAQILKRLKDGEAFWTVKKKYAHTSTQFSSGPEIVEDVLYKYQIDLHNTEPGAIYEYQFNGRKGIMIVNRVAHKVPAFCAISYNASN